MLEKFIKKNKAVGVELMFHDDGVIIQLMILEQHKGVISVLKREQFTDLEVLQEAIDDQLPVVLSVDGKGIIHKMTERVEEDDAKVLGKIFPNASPNDFYVQRTQAADEKSLVSVIRRAQLDELLLQLTFRIEHCYLGPFSTVLFANQVNEEGMLFSGIYRLEFEEGLLSDFQKEEQHTSVSLGDEVLQSQELIAFANAFSYFFPLGNVLTITLPTIDEAREEAVQQDIFKKATIAVLSLFLLIVMVNYFIFQQVYDQKNTLSNEFSLLQNAYKKYERLNTEYEEKKGFLETAGLLQSSKTSFYADRLAMDMPNTLLLTAMQVHPEDKQNSNDTLKVFSNDLIRLSGECVQSTALNNWVKDLKEKAWVKEVKIVNYAQEKKKRKALFSLEIKITT